jgi:hypothetical protein
MLDLSLLTMSVTMSVTWQMLSNPSTSRAMAKDEAQILERSLLA